MKKFAVLVLTLLLVSGLSCAAADFELRYCDYDEDYRFEYFLDDHGFVVLNSFQDIPDWSEDWSAESMNNGIHLVIPAEIDGSPVAAITDYFPSRARSYSLSGKVVSITIPDTVLLIMDGALSFPSLSEITVSPENPVYEVVDGVMFDKVNKKLICYPDGKKEESYTIPDGILTIGSSSVNNYQNLKYLTIPDSVTTVYSNSFGNFRNLEILNIGSSFTGFSDPESEEPAEMSFSFAPHLLQINVSADNPVFRSVDGVLYSADGTTLIGYPYGRTDERFDIPMGVNAIAPGALDPWGGHTISLPDSFLFENGEPRELDVSLYPLVLIDERMQHFLSKMEENHVIRSSYILYTPGTAQAIKLESKYPTLKDTPLWIGRYSTKDGKPIMKDHARLLDLFASAGYTLDDVAIYDANLATPRYLYPYTVVCPQLTREMLPEEITLIVQPDSLAYHWAVQNGISVQLDD